LLFKAMCVVQDGVFGGTRLQGLFRGGQQSSGAGGNRSPFGLSLSKPSAFRACRGSRRQARANGA
jgi:hypothetical protein